MGKQHVIYDVREQIATITLNRPEAKNALSTEMREQLDAALNETRDRSGDDVKALIITGAGGAFCAGGDVKGMNNSQQSGGVEANASRSRMRGSHSTIYNLFHIKLPVITLVDGAAAGAGGSQGAAPSAAEASAAASAASAAAQIQGASAAASASPASASAASAAAIQAAAQHSAATAQQQEQEQQATAQH